jgi:hypothetical protein
MPVPGSTTSVCGVKPVLVIWIFVTPEAAVTVGVTFTGAAVAAVVTDAIGVVVGIMVSVVTGIVVITVVVNTGAAALIAAVVVAGAVVSVVVCAEDDAVCVQPVIATSATRRIINPMSNFICSTHKRSIIK